jgi:hypothetical protein
MSISVSFVKRPRRKSTERAYRARSDLVCGRATTYPAEVAPAAELGSAYFA